MNKKRTILFRIGAILFLLIIAAIMMYIGRGHTIYVDNKAMDYNGQTYSAPYKIVVIADGKQVAKLYDEERGMSTCIGQKFNMTLEITKEKGGNEETSHVQLALPYNMDGVVINLPAFLAGLPEEAYLSKFQSAPEAVESSGEGASDEEVAPEEFVLGDI